MSEEQKGGFFARLRKDPYVSVGVLAWLGVIGYGIHHYKKQDEPLSRYILKFRVYSQAAVVGFLLLGVASRVYQHHVEHSLPEKKSHP